MDRRGRGADAHPEAQAARDPAEVRGGDRTPLRAVTVERLTLPWRARGYELACGGRTLVMGVLNVTPDSFSDGGRFSGPDAAAAEGLRMVEHGADILDVGGESTRPGAV